jgi:hypothetical protein
MTPGFEVEIQGGKKKLVKYNGNDPNVVIPEDNDLSTL